MSDALQTNITGGVLKLLVNFNQKWDKDHSLQWTLEDCLVAGIEAKRRSKEYGEDMRNKKKFEKEIATDPSIILHPDKMLALMKKYGIGASNTKFEEQVQAAAEELLDKETAPKAASAA